MPSLSMHSKFYLAVGFAENIFISPLHLVKTLENKTRNDFLSSLIPSLRALLKSYYVRAARCPLGFSSGRRLFPVLGGGPGQPAGRRAGGRSGASRPLAPHLRTDAPRVSAHSRLPARHLPPGPEVSRGGAGPASGDVTALKKGCSGMRCRWAAGLRHEALQVRGAMRRLSRRSPGPAARRHPRKPSGVSGCCGRCLHQARGGGVGRCKPRATWILACPSRESGHGPDGRRGLLLRRGKNLE